MLCKAGSAVERAEVFQLEVTWGAGCIFTGDVIMLIRMWFAEVKVLIGFRIVVICLVKHRVLTVRGGRWGLCGVAGGIITSEVIMLSRMWFAEAKILQMLVVVMVSFVKHRVWSVRGGRLDNKVGRGEEWELRLRGNA